jgi:hypothetical protein
LRPPGISFVPDPGKPLSGGIISHLARQCRRNLHEAGIVTATASSVTDTTTKYHPMRTLDLEADSLFCTQNMPNQWVCYDFHDARIRPTHYAIRSRSEGWRNSQNLRSWVLEGRNDGEDWALIDEQTDNPDLKSSNARRLYPVTAVNDYRYLRISQTGRNHAGTEQLSFSGFEIFGELVEPVK